MALDDPATRGRNLIGSAKSNGYPPAEFSEPAVDRLE